MHDIKAAQRHGEQLLVQAEAAATALAADAAERDASLARLDAAWDDLLFTEFHDILTGTSIPSAWDSVRAMQGRARITGEEVLYDLTRRWSYRTFPRVDAHQIVVLNTDASRGAPSSKPSPTSTSTTGATAGSATRPARRCRSRRCSRTRTS